MILENCEKNTNESPLVSKIPNDDQVIGLSKVFENERLVTEINLFVKSFNWLLFKLPFNVQ